MHKSYLCFFVLAVACIAAAPGAYAIRESQVQEGMDYMHQLCEDSKAPVATLTEAIRNGSLPAAKNAYTAARSYYEQIEVLAYSFPDTDADIDARPYAGFAKGEQDSEYRGFHKIEYLIFRNEDLETALGFAETLEASVNTLCVELTETDRFSQELTWKGAISLAIEVPAKKISSEEETWSDLSMMIFRENLKGIWGVISPFLDDMNSSIRADVQSAYDELVKEFNEICPQYPFNTSSGQACLYSTISISDRRSLVSDYYSLANALLAAKSFLNISDPVEESEITATASATPSPSPTPSCVEEAWLIEHDVDLLHERQSIMAEVVCPVGFPCGTKDHVLIMNHVAMSYGDLCVIQSCTTKHTFVNGFRAHQMIPLSQNGNLVTGHVTYEEHGLQNFILGVARMQYKMGMYLA
eukprot:CAMPEP_0184696316 /NCGR_PEP_ID=MMETSP0313-20130426/3658_1 /TAXON_ID=2792 /ORGANISM="Porphyridium aerugineum, Strain SAG 1380-2" /LENGTH=411 /DNA_ID=CAMNT_0027154925 /DNA_START=166 /DNA_END=1401 /DNA_ORIENTATION=-